MSSGYKKARYIFTAIIITLVLYSCNQEVSVTPPDSPPPNGYVFLESNPNGARIFVDGKDTRRITPDSLTYLTTGSYTFTFKKNLFRDTTFVYKVVEGERKSTLIDYTKNPLMLGQINCDSSPGGAEIFLNDSATGRTTPAVLKQIVPGYYNVRYHYNNFKDNQVNLVVQSNQVAVSNLTMIDTTVWQEFNTSNSPISSNYLTCVVVDKNNTVWIGTEDQGLAKYNGSTWEFIRPQDNLPNNLQDNYVTALGAEDNGTVWVGTKNGLLLFSGPKIEKYNSIFWGDTSFPSKTDTHVKDIKPKSDGSVFFAVDSNFVRESNNPLDNTRLWETQLPVFYGILSAVDFDKSSNYWVGTKSHGLIMYNKNIPGITYINTSTTREIGDSVTAIAVSKSGTVWIGYKWSVAAGSGLSYYNGTLKAPGVIPYNKNTNTIFIDNSNRKWIGTNAGLVEFSDVSSTTIYDSQTTGLNMDDVTGIAQDQQGRIWIATRGGGLFLKKK